MSAEYVPQNASEQYFYDALWKFANPAGEGELSGIAAVTFFQKSGVDIGILKQIWSLSTPTASMNIQQFYSAIRYITMMQQGEIPLNKERLRSAGKVNLGLPKFNGVEIPAYKAPVAAPAVNPALYAITPKDHTKYHELFLTYDADRDGFLSYDEGMNVFRQSGLDPATLTAIYAIADDDKDMRLTSKEFCVAFHLIICISKKSLPLPAAIPAMLKGFLLNAPAVPVPVTAHHAPISAPQNQVPVPVPVHHEAPAPLPRIELASPVPVAPVAAVEKSGFDAFDSVDTPAPAPLAQSSFSAPVTVPVVAVPSAVQSAQQQPAAQQQYAPAHVQSHSAAPVSRGGALSYTENDEYELSNGIDAYKATAKKALASQEHLLDYNSKALSSLTGLKQRLAADRVSFEATVNNALANTQESIVRLETTIAEVATLAQQLKELRDSLEHARKTNVDVEERHHKVALEKAQLVRSIEEAASELSAINNEAINKTNEISATTSDVNVTKAATQAATEQEAALRQNVSDLSNEISTLRHVLAMLTANKDQANRQVGMLNSKLNVAKNNLKTETNTLTAKKRDVAALRQQEATLKDQKVGLLGEISSSSESATGIVTATSGTVVAAPTADPFESFGDDFGSSAKSNGSAFDDGEAWGAEPTHAPTEALAGSFPAGGEFESFQDPEEESDASHSFEDIYAAEQPIPDTSRLNIVTDSSSTKAGTAGAVSEATPATSVYSNTVVSSNTSPVPATPLSASAFDDAFAEADSSATDDAFAGFGDSTAAASDAFNSNAFGSEDTAAPITDDAAFSSFGEETANVADQTPVTDVEVSKDDAFDSFDTAPASTNATSAFDSFGDAAPPTSDGFDAFDAFSSTSVASGAFDAFGPIAAPSSVGEGSFDDAFSATSPSNSNGFDAFGDSSFKTSGTAHDTAGDDDPFSSFAAAGAPPSSDDPFNF